MSEQENTKVVQQAYENFKSGDIAALLEQFADDIQWQLPEVENVSYAGKRSGREQAAQFFSILAGEQDVLSFEPREFVAQGEKVVALGHYAWRAKSTGREYESDFAHVFTVRGGKVESFQEFMDTAAVAAAHQKARSA